MTIFDDDPQTAQREIDACPRLASLRGVSLGLSVNDMIATAAAIEQLIADFYVHLPLKRSALAIDPVQELAILQDDVKFGLDEVTFIARLQRTISTLRDRHTSLVIPWGDAVAFLPVVLEGVWENGTQRLIVSKILGEPTTPGLGPGARITHWNGVPVDTWVRRIADQTNGANPQARIAVALRSLSVAPLAYQQVPDADWVTLSYVSTAGDPGAATFPWRILVPPAEAEANSRQGEASGAALQIGLDKATLAVNNSWQAIFSAPRSEPPKRLSQGGTPDYTITTLAPVAGLPAVKSATMKYQGSQYGYLRIFSFDAPDVGAWSDSMAAALRAMPTDGLIVDVRANPGGAIPAAETLLSMLTSRTVLPSPLQFRTTDAIASLVNDTEWFVPWQRSMALRFDTGEIFTQGFPLIDADSITKHTGVYTSPAILINDALSYSATDFFSAGWQDNGIGPIIGIDGLTGAGGANVWTYAQIQSLIAGATTLPTTLPAGFEINLSVRRSTRVLANEGIPVEGLGVRADLNYQMTTNDVLGGNQDLISFAAAWLGLAPVVPARPR